MTDEEIEAMQAEIQKEKDTLPDDMQGPVLSGPPQGAVPQAEPEDNTVENAEEEESLTPGLDDEVSKSVVSINNRRR
jgi:hypothetical protein